MDYFIPPDVEVHDDSIVFAPTNLWHLPKAVWEEIWNKEQGEGIKVAVLDTGFTSHPDLPEPIAQRSFINGQSVRDGNGHGTHCCGTVLGRNGIGVAPRASLIVGKVLSNEGSGSSTGIARGIRWAVDEGADIISMSLGGGGSDAETNQAIDYALSRGCLVNAAAGNSGYNGQNTIGWPAKYINCLCNGAIREDGTIANFSSGGRELDWATPGQNIISANTSNGYAKMSGTSMATPFGSGLLALIVSLMRKAGLPRFASTDAVRKFFEQWCEDKGNPGHDVRYGYGVPRSSDIVNALLYNEIVFA